MRAVHPDAELAPRDVVARGVFREIAGGRGAFLDAAQRRAELRRAFPDRSSQLPARPASIPARADPGRAGRALPHGRHLHVDAQRPQLARRAVGLRRGRLDRRAWREPAGLQLAARGRGVRCARGARRRRVLADGRTGKAARDAYPADGGAQSDKAEHELRQTMAADVGVIRDAGSLTNALLTICALERDAPAIGASATCCRPPN